MYEPTDIDLKVFESLIDPTVKLNPWLRKVVLENEQPVVEDDSPDISVPTNGHRNRSNVGLLMSSVIRIPEYLQYEPKLLDEIVLVHRDVQKTCIKLREKMYEVTPDSRNEVFLDLPKLPRTKIAPKRLYAFYQRTYGVFLSFEVMLNGILQAYSPGDAMLAVRSFQICEELRDLSLAASELRPLGAGWIPVCLVSAWGASPDAQSKILLEQVWTECWADYSRLDLPACGKQLETLYKRLRHAVLNANVMSPVITLQ